MAKQPASNKPRRAVSKPAPKQRTSGQSIQLKGNQWARATSKPTTSSRPLPAPKSATPPAKK